LTKQELLLPAEKESVTRARHALDEETKDLPAEVREDVRLLVSELVSNSVRHAGLAPDDLIGVSVEVEESRLRVEVSDQGPGFTPVSTPSLETGSGFGLRLVDQLAHRWGVLRDDRVRVWFEIEHP
jgi:anti-sigma regulatory factor (Ser/Thr protein kinase)